LSIEEVRILTVSGDAGGTQALAPVVAHLQGQPNVSVAAYGYRWAPAIFDAKGLACNLLPTEISSGAIGDLLTAFKPDLVFTATSIGPDSLESWFISVAKKLGISTLTVLDYWSRYTERFMTTDGPEWQQSLPDCIAIMDEETKFRMVELGFVPERLNVTGQPALDALHLLRSVTTATSRLNTRQAHDVDDSAMLITFLSSPVSSDHSEGTGNANELGYTELSALELLITELEHVAEGQGRQVHLLIKPHPRDPKGHFAHVRSNKVRVSVVDAIDHRELTLASDLVVGIISIALLEACLLGKPIISLQPGLLTEDMLPSNRWGATIPVHNAADLRSLLQQFLDGTLLSHPERVPELLRDGHGTERVATLALAMAQRMTGSQLVDRPPAMETNS
jgi:hypothetical protein